MDKNECKAVVELLSVTWNQAIDASSITIKAKGFWEYVEDLPYENVKETIKHMGLAGRKWAPRPGELRIAVLANMRDEELPPEPEEAWTVLQAIGQKIYSGTYDYEKPHPVLAETIKRLGTNATALTTNSDRAMFVSLYEKTREAYILERYGYDSAN
tara:strand:- start:122 stop:592 length:471 start_codon:yes stop_codon:yes gene_type:complete